MASLNTLRTKFGLLLSVIIAGALLAFILSLKAEMGFSGNDPKVGVIDGDKILYSEYYAEYEQVKNQSGAQESDEQQSAALANAVWQSLISKHVMEPGFEKMGLRLTEKERMALISGEIPSQAFYSVFVDPRTGMYNVEAIAEFLAQAEADPQAQQAWAQLLDQARKERLFQKYLGLVRGGSYVNALEVAAGVATANESYAGKWVGKKYASVPDSLVSVSDSEVKAYYNAHKNVYKQTPSRALTYVLFEVAATDDDMLALENEVKTVAAEFMVAESPKSFARANRNGRVSDNYVSAAQLSTEEAEVLLAGKPYGPVLKNNEWTMARVLDTKVVPDSLGIRHIVLPYTEDALADSLLTVLRGGANFAEVAAKYSVYEATAANGGEVGVMPFSSFTGEFVAPLASAKKGDILKIASGDAIQLMQVYSTTKPVKHVQVATITYPVQASENTRRTVHSQAGTFTVNAKGSLESFNDAAATAAITPRVATLTQGERTIRGLEDSREVARWAYSAEVGDLSEIITVDGDYVIAMLTEIDDAEYVPFEQVAGTIRAQLLRDKKFNYIAASISGSTLEEMGASLGSEVADFSEVSGVMPFVAGMGYEPRVVGAIAEAEVDAVSAPVKGLSGLYIFQKSATTNTEKQTAEGEKVRAQAMAESAAQQMSFMAIQQMAEIEDLRGRYF